jgi:hypothetical protein
MEKRKFVSLALWLITQVCIGCGGDGTPTTPVSPSPAVAPASPAPPTSQPPVPPGPFGYTLAAVSLSGTVYEVTPEGRVPIPGIGVYCELCGTETHTWAVADSKGFYIFPADLSTGGGIWLSARNTPVLVESRGYRDPDGFSGSCSWLSDRYSCREVFIQGDTQLDVELVKLTNVDAASPGRVRARAQP